jgi:hypothetical protein
LETDIFEWISENDALYIVTGAGYDDIDHPNEIDGVAIPTYYWKAICDRSKNQSAAFWGYNDDKRIPMENFKTVREIEERIYKNGEIFPESKCNTRNVDQSFWGWSTSSYHLPGLTVSDIIEQNPHTYKKELKDLYHKHRAEYKREVQQRLKAKQQKQRQQ